MSIYFKEARMPLAILLAGQAFGIAYATGAAIFIALVWIIPNYAIQPQTKIIIKSSGRRASIDSTLSASPTLVESERLPMKGRVGGIIGLSNKKSQVLTKLSSSIAPVAKRLSVPTKKLTTSVASKMSPQKMVADAQAKCTAIMSSVHERIPRSLPNLKKSTPLHTGMSATRAPPVLTSCSSAVKKFVTPANEPVKWRRPKKQATL